MTQQSQGKLKTVRVNPLKLISQTRSSRTEAPGVIVEPCLSLLLVSVLRLTCDYI